MFSGYTGYMALGNAVFYGSGAYAFANLTSHLHLNGGVGSSALVPLAGLVAGLVALPGRLAGAAHPAAHLRGHHDRDLLHLPAAGLQPALADQRLVGHVTADPAVGRPDLQHLLLPGRAGGRRGRRSRVAWAVRRSQLRAGAAGHPRRRGPRAAVSASGRPRVKLATFVLTGFLTGMCGAIYAYYLGSIYPPFAFEAIFDVTIALMAFLGGLGTISGPGHRRADPRAGPAVHHPAVHRRRVVADRLRRAVPDRHPVPAGGHRAVARRRPPPPARVPGPRRRR